MKKDYIEFQGLRLCLKTKEKMQLGDMIGNPLTYLFGMMGGMDEDDMDFSKLQLPPLKFSTSPFTPKPQTKDRINQSNKLNPNFWKIFKLSLEKIDIYPIAPANKPKIPPPII